MEPSFMWELCKRTGGSVLASMGTTGLAVVVGFVVIPCIFLLTRLVRHGRAKVIAHWKENLRDVAVTTAVIWLLLFCFHLFYKVPHEIRIAARQNVPPPLGPSIPPLFAFQKGLQESGEHPKNQQIYIAMRFFMSSRSINRSPAFSIVNESDPIARNIRWGIVLWNTEMPERLTTIPIFTYPIDWVKGHEATGRVTIWTPEPPELKTGDKLIGTSSVDCPDCIRRSYVLCVTWGVSAWYGETGKEWKGKLVMPVDGVSRAGREAYFKQVIALIPSKSRIPMSEQ